MRKRRYLVFVLSILLFCISTTKVLGATTAELDELGKAVTPEGLSLKKDDMNSYFEYTPSFEDGTPNHSTIRTGLNKKYPNSDAVQLTDSIKQLSSIWSNKDKGNYINTKVPQTLSMWLYFGHADVPADGIAFVLQSDPRETKAISTYKGSVTRGETLGVWGPDIDGRQSSTSVIAAGAIQKSWALEFDTFLNRFSTAGKGSYFDYSFKGSINGNQHMAFNYPAQTSTYFKKNIGGYVYELNHSNGLKYKEYTNYFQGKPYTYGEYAYEDDNNDIRTNLNLTRSNSGENSWHHLTVNYLPPSDGTNNATLTYSFNDKKADGTPGSMLTTEPDLPYTNKTSLDLTKVLPTENGIITDHRLRYGFTGSTGDYSSLNMAVFETMPSLVNASSDVKVYNVSQENREIKSGDMVTYNNNLMKFSYNLNYLTGDNELKNVTAKITLPSNITYANKGIIGNVIYSDGEVEPVPVSEMTSDNVLTHKLARTMNDKLKGAKLEITGVATVNKLGELEQNTVVKSAHATLMGDLYKGDVNTPQFTIAQAPRHLIIGTKPSSLEQKVKFGDPIHFDGTIKYVEEMAVEKENISILVSVDGRDTFFVDDYNLDKGNFSFDVVNKEKFTAGTHKVDIQAVEKTSNGSEYRYGLSSNILDYQVTVISPPKLDKTTDNALVVTKEKGVSIPARITYDGGYKFNSEDLTWHMKILDESGNPVSKGDITSKIQNIFTDVPAQDFTQKFSTENLEITKAGKYKAEVYVKDNKNDLSSNSVTYDLIYISKSSTLVYDKYYSFQDVNTSNESKIVNRSGKWKLGVNSVDTGWKLTAQASQLNNTDENGKVINTLNGNMIFVDQSNVVHDLSDATQTLIGYQNDQVTSDFDISSHWKPNQGILLKLQPNPLKGKYSGTIFWTLKNTP